jgi:aspartate aminotransferase
VEGALLHTPREYFSEMRDEYMARRDVLVRCLSAIPGVTVPNIDGAFYAMAKLPIDDSDKFCQWMLEEFSFEGKTVMMAPGTGFYVTPGLGKQEVRFAYVYKCEELEIALEVLKKGLESYPGRVV